jgi:hypothetical protein
MAQFLIPENPKPVRAGSNRDRPPRRSRLCRAASKRPRKRSRRRLTMALMTGHPKCPLTLDDERSPGELPKRPNPRRSMPAAGCQATAGTGPVATRCRPGPDHPVRLMPQASGVRTGRCRNEKMRPTTNGRATALAWRGWAVKRRSTFGNGVDKADASSQVQIAGWICSELTAC